MTDEPEPVFDDLYPVWNAWHDLSTSRPTGMTSSGIPWAEQSRYCEDHGIDGAERLRLIRLLRAMDMTYMRHLAGESKARRREVASGNP